MSHKCYAIAEIGVNHNGDKDLASQLIKVAAEAGADAVKFQTFFADELVTRNAQKAAYQKATTDADQSQYDMLKALELGHNDLVALNSECQKLGIDFLSTPFSFKAVDLLEDVGVGAFKVSSGDLTYVQMLDHIARKNKPIILSTGMATMSEIETAVRTIEAAGNTSISILHCVSNYPAAPEDCNLRAMATIHAAFGYPVGWSDHTVGEATTLAAVALGACVIEKHITLAHTMAGPDHSASMEPAEFREMMVNLRIVEAALGNGVKRPTAAELDTAAVARRSLTVARALEVGHIICAEDIVMLRPGHGLPPKDLDFAIGRALTRAVASGETLLHDHFDSSRVE